MFKVLVVDDSPLMRQWVSRSVAMTGVQLEIQHAVDGLDAYEKTQELRPDLIITDLHMPVMSGDELIQALEIDDGLRSIPVIVLTADGERATAEQLDERPGVLVRLRKPVRPEQLREHLAQAIRAAAERGADGRAEEVTRA